MQCSIATIGGVLAGGFKDVQAYCPAMPLPWPFRRRKPVPTGYETVDYTAEEDTEDVLSDRSHIEDGDYQKALMQLEGVSLDDAGQAIKQTVVESEVIHEAALGDLMETAAALVDDTTGEQDGEWIYNNDGYWYLRKDDGSFDDTPHIKKPDGTMKPFKS